MSEEEKSIFDEAEVTEEMPQEGDLAPDEDNNEEEGEFKPTISNESPQEKLERQGKKEKADGRIVTIKEIGFTKPKRFGPNMEPIPPKTTIKGDKEFYPGKLKIKFEEDNLVEYYPNFHYFVNEGKVSTLAKINRGGKNAVAQIFKLAVPLIGKPMEEISDAEFFEWLVGKKVKLKTEEGEYNGRKWFRNDIAEFVVE